MKDLVGNCVSGAPPGGSPEPLLEERVASYFAEVKREVLEQRGHFARKARWPGGRQFAACLTHDVDNVERPLRHILSRRERFTTGGLLLAVLGVRSLYNNIGYVAKLERERGVRSTFFLMSSEYDLGKLKRQVDSLASEGWEFGLHGDFGTHDSADKMGEALGKFEARLGRRPEGVREHYLQFDYSKTWGILEGKGLLYDATVGNRDSLGYRAGLCSPFRPPSSSWEPMNLIELPLVLMDTTLWGYLKLGEEEGLRRSFEMLAKVSALGGLFTLLWHQESVRMKGGRQFIPILDRISREGCYVANGAEVAKWWAERAVPLVWEDGAYRLRGGPPRGLVLEVVAQEGLKPKATGGKVLVEGKTTLVSVESKDFSLKVE